MKDWQIILLFAILGALLGAVSMFVFASLMFGV